MRGKYRGLVTVSKVLRVVAILVVVVGILSSFWFSLFWGWSFAGSGAFGWARVFIILGICGSLIAGVLIYSFGEVIKLLLDGDMRGEYRGLVTVSKVLSVVAILVVVVGIWFSVLWGWAHGASAGVDRGSIAAFLGICGSLLAGVLIYSFGQVIKLLLDIETGIRVRVDSYQERK